MDAATRILLHVKYLLKTYEPCPRIVAVIRKIYDLPIVSVGNIWLYGKLLDIFNIDTSKSMKLITTETMINLSQFLVNNGEAIGLKNMQTLGSILDLRADEFYCFMFDFTILIHYAYEYCKALLPII